ncbi:hypothetical protein KBC86_05440 [Candidatus Gracilibacteria bacterium]|nr:hypothetical protein [Candidatus Gracilibacteria bacterium]
MELKEFIKNVILDIHGAISEVDTLLPDTKYFVGNGNGNSDDHKSEVNFDLSVYSDSKVQGGVDGSIKVAGMIGLGSKIAGETSERNLSRIQFVLKNKHNRF